MFLYLYKWINIINKKTIFNILFLAFMVICTLDFQLNPQNIFPHLSISRVKSLVKHLFETTALAATLVVPTLVIFTTAKKSPVCIGELQGFQKVEQKVALLVTQS